MRRYSSLKVAQRNRGIMEIIHTLKADHPFWGYRRIWAYLKFADGFPVNKNASCVSYENMIS